MIIEWCVCVFSFNEIYLDVLFSDELEDTGDNLFNGFIPPSWRRWMPATEKPLGSWIISFSLRLLQFQSWIADGEPASIWLSGLQEPSSYLTALVQTTCRIRKWALDKSTQYTTVSAINDVSEVVNHLESGSYVHGLFLEGASWDRNLGCLVPQKPKLLYMEIPLLIVTPIEASKLKLSGTFRTPVYVTQSRKNAMGVGLVFEADLSSHDHMSLWVLQGVALVLNTRE